MIKAIIFDLDNTLLDFMKMKKIAITAAVEGMVEAGLNVVPSEAYTKIVDLYESGGWENQEILNDADFPSVPKWTRSIFCPKTSKLSRQYIFSIAFNSSTVCLSAPLGG